eukprot:TRINITY_DN8725_c0_g1_i1.p1 TRINITY_DN8725_c0_g1~~TRINITY_DN8725_c0_g1_i1.p1  ORF type:complete len:253 (-),score=52.57 TRINITY_DN8725_c0_g1_i1:851-1609(-)
MGIQQLKERFIEEIDLNSVSPEMITSSYFFSTLTTALIRTATTIYAWVVLIAQLSYYYNDGVFFTYFTHWSFILLTFYLTLVTYFSWRYHFSGKEFLETNIILSNRAHCFKMWVWFEIAAAAAFGLDPIYWVALYDGDSSSWTNYHVHGVNALYVLADLACNRLKFYKSHFAFFALYLFVYLIFMWIYYGISGDWVYSVLDFTEIEAVIWYPASLVTFIVFYFLLVYIVHLRGKLHDKIHPTANSDLGISSI